MIRYTVEEPQETEQSELTANQILGNAYFDPNHFYLVEIRGKERISYKDRGTEKIHLHDGLKFIAVHTGPMPVSEVPPAGAARFMAELQALGFEVKAADNGQLAFLFNVENGSYAGRTFTIGVAIPPQFPLHQPTGIHVSPRLHPNQSGGMHPMGGIHDSPFGPEFQYWSRPFNDWANTKRRAADYLAFIRQLWATQ